jgi:tRNA(Leu) C34 or U34 (ribose-2'-O)-methylase TrmL
MHSGQGVDERLMKKSKAIIGLMNPKNPENVGAVLRAAGNFGADSVLYTGKRYPLAVERNPDAPNISRKASQDIPITGVSCLLESVPMNMEIVCVEFAENATPLPDYQHPYNAFYIFGPEDGTIPQDLIDKADDVVYVPTNGCMNLSATVTVVLYDRLSKASGTVDNNTAVRENRDTNNRLTARKKPG